MIRQNNTSQTANTTLTAYKINTPNNIKDNTPDLPEAIPDNHSIVAQTSITALVRKPVLSAKEKTASQLDTHKRSVIRLGQTIKLRLTRELTNDLTSTFKTKTKSMTYKER